MATAAGFSSVASQRFCTSVPGQGDEINGNETSGFACILLMVSGTCRVEYLLPLRLQQPQAEKDQNVGWIPAANMLWLQMTDGDGTLSPDAVALGCVAREAQE